MWPVPMKLLSLPCSAIAAQTLRTPTGNPATIYAGRAARARDQPETQATAPLQGVDGAVYSCYGCTIHRLVTRAHGIW